MIEEILKNWYQLVDLIKIWSLKCVSSEDSPFSSEAQRDSSNSSFQSISKQLPSLNQFLFEEQVQETSRLTSRYFRRKWEKLQRTTNTGETWSAPSQPGSGVAPNQPQRTESFMIDPYLSNINPGSESGRKLFLKAREEQTEAKNIDVRTQTNSKELLEMRLCFQPHSRLQLSIRKMIQLTKQSFMREHDQEWLLNVSWEVSSLALGRLSSPRRRTLHGSI